MKFFENNSKNSKSFHIDANESTMFVPFWPISIQIQIQCDRTNENKQQIALRTVTASLCCVAGKIPIKSYRERKNEKRQR